MARIVKRIPAPPREPWQPANWYRVGTIARTITGNRFRVVKPTRYEPHEWELMTKEPPHV